MKICNDNYDPIEEVYDIREQIMEEFGWNVRKYCDYLRAKQPEMEAMGFKFLTEEETAALRNR